MARLSDATLMLVLGLLGSLVASLVVGLLAIGATDNFLADDGSGAAGGLTVLWVLLMALAMLLTYRYEVVPTARDGQTTAKRAHKLAVVSYPVCDDTALSRRASRIRWVVPHGAFVAGSAAGLVSTSALGPWGLVGAPGVGIAAWIAVYASALVDGNRRGWHDKLAGTVVVKTDFRGDPVVAEPVVGMAECDAVRSRRRSAPKPVMVAIALLMTTAPAAATSVARTSCCVKRS